MKSVSVRFQSSGQQYHYLVLEGDEPECGDLVITSMQWADRSQGYATRDTGRIGMVVEIHETASDKATKFYLQLVSRKVIEERQRANKSILEKARERKRIRAELTRMMAEESERSLFANLAAANPAAAELLAKLDELK